MCLYNNPNLHTPQNKNLDPCWFYNQPGGCSKTAEECVYTHKYDQMVKKPLHLQHPCHNLHVLGECKNIDLCINDHKYELTRGEWNHHFKIEYPGSGYLNKKSNILCKPGGVLSKNNYFYILSTESCF